MSWEQTIQRVRPILVARATRMLGERHYGAGAPRAEDLVQITLLKLGQQEARAALGEAPSEEAVRRFSLRVLHNAFIDACTRKKRELLATPSAGGEGDLRGPIESSDPETELLAREAFVTRQALLERALAQLPEQERSFLRACLTTGSAPAAQELLGWPPGTAANACKRRNSIVQRIQRAVAEGLPAPARDAQRAS